MHRYIIYILTSICVYIVWGLSPTSFIRRIRKGAHILSLTHLILDTRFSKLIPGVNTWVSGGYHNMGIITQAFDKHLCASRRLIWDEVLSDTRRGLSDTRSESVRAFRQRYDDKMPIY